MRIVVIDNGGGGIFEFLPQADQLERDEFEAILGTPLGLEPERVASLHGLAYLPLTTLDPLSSLPAEAVLVELKTDRGENVALHRQLADGAQAAVSAALG